MRPPRKFVWSFLAPLCTLMPAPARAQAAACDKRAIDSASYTSTICAQAGTSPRGHDWWNGLDITAFGDSSTARNRASELADLNASST
jgi:hypothetical protein